MIQRHDARRLHYDFRLERDGALASWAVPKGVPLRKGERHLAVHVEDHPLEYADFEGVIPAGQYGAGTVEIWDRGTYDLLEEKRDGGLTVRLHGERLDGVWTLVPAALDGDPKNWLLLRKDADDGAAGRRYQPMLATSSDTLPSGEGWVFEPKWDGFRAIVTVSGGEVTLTSRNGNDLTERFRDVARAAAHAITTPDAVLDGEICALDDEGRSRFSLLQEGGGTVVLVLFDLLELESERPRRRAALRAPQAARGHRRSEQRRPRLAAVRRRGGAARGRARAGARGRRRQEDRLAYKPGRRSTDWHKVKLRQTQEVVIAGYTRGQGRRSGGFGALVVGVHDAGVLRWAGNVGTGFSDSEIERLLRLLAPLERPESPFAEVPKMPRVRRSDVTWVEPKLVAEVEFAEWTHEGRLRAPSYLRVREDKAAPDVRRERAPLPTVVKRGRRELRLSNLDKPFWPEEGITKGDLIAYYRDVAEVLVPHLRAPAVHDEALPRRLAGQELLPEERAVAHARLDRARPVSRVDARGREEDHRLRARERRARPALDGEHGLHRPARVGVARRSPGAARLGHVRPRPVRGVGLRGGRSRSPQLVKETLDLLELESYPKTSGSRGIHVLVPIARRHSFEEAREFAGIVAGALARAHPGLATTEWAKEKRRGVLVDANQNGPGRTNASVYSVRPRAGAPVSTPLRWDEVVSGLDPTVFTMDAVLDRVSQHGDLFAGALAGKQSLKAALKSLR